MFSHTGSKWIKYLAHKKLAYFDMFVCPPWILSTNSLCRLYTIHRLYNETTSALYGGKFRGLTEQQTRRVVMASKVLQRPLEAQN